MRYSIVALLLLSLTATAAAQSQRFAFEHITAEDELPDNLVRSVYQDRLGFMWFSSGGSIVQYDGYNMTERVMGLAATQFHEDRQGILWIASLAGLLAFDRDTQTFQHFRHVPGDSSTISGPSVMLIHEDQHGYLWLITGPLGFQLHPERTFLDRFDPLNHSVTRFRNDPANPASIAEGQIPDNRTHQADKFRFAFHEDADGIIWIGTDTGGLNRYDADTNAFIRFRHDARDSSSLSSDHVTAITHDGRNRLWVGTQSDGLNVLRGQAGKFVRYMNSENDPNSLCDNRILDLYTDHSGTVWITTPRGICYYDAEAGTFGHYAHDPSDYRTPGPGPVFVAAEEANGNLWLISDHTGQMDYFDRDAGRFVRYEQDLRDEGSLRRLAGILSVVVDRSGVLWVGTWQGGINKLARSVQKFRVYRHDTRDPGSLSDDYVTAIHSDPDGVVWIGARGLNRFVPDTTGELRVTFDRFVHDPSDPSSLSNDYISDIHASRTGDLWVGTEGGGLNRMDRSDGTFVHFFHDPSDPSSLSDNRVTSLAEDSAGTLWVGTRDGLNRFDRSSGTFTRYRRIDGDNRSLCTNEVHRLYVDREGAVWAGGNLGGLCRLDDEGGQFSRYLLYSPFETVISMFEDTRGHFWVGTHGHGLYRLNRSDSTFIQYTERDGLAHDKVKLIVEDRVGHLWIATERGLSRFDPATETFRNYGVDDGLPSHYITRQDAGDIDQAGRLLFGTDRGLVVVDPEYVRHADNAYPPPVVLTGLKIFNRPVTVTDASYLEKHISTADAITLPYDKNDLSIAYAALHYARSEGNRYAYHLEGYEEAWRDVGTLRTATYTNLDPGDYTFRVKAANSDGVWNEAGASLKITILPPFWMTWWFRSLAFVSLCLAGFALYRKRISVLERKRLELEERVRERTEAAATLQEALTEVERLRDRLQAENIYLQEEITLQHNFEDIITSSDALKKVLHTVEQVAATEATVLILGETGTGKELLARAIHRISPRGDRPLVKVNCAALPSDLIESELFGHEKGAFTGAVSRKIGRFELADGGTIFLDEIGDLPLELQAKLLRVLQEGEFERLGGTTTIRVDVRVIAATNRDLSREKQSGAFREDLYYRLSVFPIESPPLRERKEDVPLLVRHFVDKYSKKTGKRIEGVPESVIASLQSYDWPGNVRELENVIERSVILSPGPKLVLPDAPARDGSAADGTGFLSLEELERQHIEEALDRCGGQVFGQKGAARLLDMNPQTLTSRMKRLGIKRRSERL